MGKVGRNGLLEADHLCHYDFKEQVEKEKMKTAKLSEATSVGLPKITLILNRKSANC